MPISLKHAFTNPKSDGGDTTVTRPSDWNAEHLLTMATSRVLGRVSSGAGAAEELTAEQMRTFLDVGGTSAVTTVIAASYTLVIGDRGKTIGMTSGSANTLTVPTNTSVPFPVGTLVWVLQFGAGTTTVVGSSGVTLRSRAVAPLTVTAQYGIAQLYKVLTNEWIVSGDIT